MSSPALHLDRRRLLASLGIAGTASLAGCSATEPAPDRSTTTLSEERTRALAEAYAPTLYFDEDEQWFPTDPRAYESTQDGEPVVDGFDALNDYTAAAKESDAPLHEHDRLPAVERGDLIPEALTISSFSDLTSPPTQLPNRTTGSVFQYAGRDEAFDDELIKGPNIGDVPLKDPLEAEVGGEVLLKMTDNITTDHIIPATQDILMHRSNVPKLSEFTLSRVDDTFAECALEADGGVLVAGENYGQGSSREHTALCPMYLGIERVLAQSFARIRKANLFNFGIVPLEIDEDTYEKIEQGDDIEIVDDAAEAVRSGQEEFTICVNDDWEASGYLDNSPREREILAAGGELSHTKAQHQKGGAAHADDYRASERRGTRGYSSSRTAKP